MRRRDTADSSLGITNLFCDAPDSFAVRARVARRRSSVGSVRGLRRMGVAEQEQGGGIGSAVSKMQMS